MNHCSPDPDTDLEFGDTVRERSRRLSNTPIAQAVSGTLAAIVTGGTVVGVCIFRLDDGPAVRGR